MKYFPVINVGADLELALVKNDSVIVESRIPGTKAAPLPLSRGSFHKDNVWLEIQPLPSSSCRELLSNTLSCAEEAVRVINASLKTSYSYEWKIAVRFPPGALKKDPGAMEFGCEPDYDAYTGEKCVLDPKKARGLRTCSGHIHIQTPENWDNETKMSCVRTLDASLGMYLTSVARTDMIIPARTRRTLYGQAGRFRFKPYGLEYRTPDPMWTKLGAKALQIMFNCIGLALEHPGLADQVFSDADSRRFIKNTINECRVADAASFYDQFATNVATEL